MMLIMMVESDEDEVQDLMMVESERMRESLNDE